MTKFELINKWGTESLNEVAFWEDLEPFKPFYYKAKQIAKNLKVETEQAEEMLKDYQHFMAI